MPEERLGQKRKLDHVDLECGPASFQRTDHVFSKSQDKEILCFNCRKIDLRAILKLDIQQLRRKKWGKVVARFENRAPAWETATCSLCRFFAACRIRIPEISEGFTFDYHLRAFPFFSVVPEIQFNAGAHENLVAAEIVCLAVLPGKGHSKTTEHIRHIVQIDELERNKSTGVICPVALTEYGNSTKFGGRIVDTEVDFELLRGWINFCQENHNKTLCAIKRKTHANLQLIDCERKLVVKAPPGCTYVALSYVWGPQPCDKDIGYHPPQSQTVNSLPESIPIVVQDAIIATQRLGWRYLWVDRYCIDQDDVENKHDQIRAMDRIYARAVVTLVAAAGSDADFGLPGVHHTPRQNQPLTTTRGIMLTSTLAHPEASIHNSKWASRGWTYQEAMLSTRRLVFTQEQVYYECRSMSACESISKPLTLINRSHGKKGSVAKVRRGYFEKHRGQYTTVYDLLEPKYNESVKELERHVTRYTARELSYPSDSLNAFMGILSLYRSGDREINHFLGLPIFRIERSTAKVNMVPSFFASLVDDELTGTFIKSLHWEHEARNNRTPPRRNREFPSYTWVGWKGVATLAHFPVGTSTFATDVVILSSSYELQRLLRQRDSLSIIPTIDHTAMDLNIEVNVTKLQLQRSRESDSSGHATVIIVDHEQNENHLGNACLTRDYLQEEAFAVDCLIMGHEYWGSQLWLLLIQWCDGTAERIGTARGEEELIHYLERSPMTPITRRKVTLG